VDLFCVIDQACGRPYRLEIFAKAAVVARLFYL